MASQHFEIDPDWDADYAERLASKVHQRFTGAHPELQAEVVRRPPRWSLRYRRGLLTGAEVDLDLRRGVLTVGTWCRMDTLLGFLTLLAGLATALYVGLGLSLAVGPFRHGSVKGLLAVAAGLVGATVFGLIFVPITRRLSGLTSDRLVRELAQLCGASDAGEVK